MSGRGWIRRYWRGLLLKAAAGFHWAGLALCELVDDDKGGRHARGD